MDINLLDNYGISKEIVKEYIDKVKNQEKIIAVSGEFSAGKSTFINALINKKGYLPSANIECTPVLIDLVRDNGNYIEIKHNDGSVEKKEATEENINKYAKNAIEYDKTIVGVTIPVKSEYLFEKYHLIDTPGTNTIHKEHEIITKQILRKADLVLYVFNKSLTNHDIEKISEIKKYTDQILFIVSNMDEKVNDTYVNRSKESISIFIEEATKELECKLGLDTIILPIGSKVAFEDNSLINTIRENIKFIAASNNENRLKENAKRQLSIIFEKRLEELQEELFLSRSILEIDEEKLNKKISKLNNKINDIKLDDESLKNTFTKIVEVNRNKIKNELSNIYDDAKEELLNKILVKEEVDEVYLEELFDITSDCINIKVKSYLDNFINNIINSIYLDNNLKLEGINIELDIKLVAELHKPTIEELDLTCDSDILKLKEEKIINSYKIDEVMQEVAVGSSNLEEIKSNMNKAREHEDKVNSELRLNGAYKPEYEEIYEESGEEMGRTIGRVIGEVADIALIFFTPSGSATAAAKTLKAADTVKDGVKFTQYLAKGVQGVKKGVNTANKVMKKVSEEDQGKILKALDLLSVGGLGERIGGALGEKIKPSNTIYVENEEKKQEWLYENDLLKEEKNEIKKKQAKLEYELEQGNTNIIQAMKRKTELEAQLALINQREDILIARKEKQYNANSKMLIENYYKSEISSICQSEFDETVEKVSDILEAITEEVLIKSSNEFNNRLKILEQSIDEVACSKNEINDKLVSQEKLISELSNYKTWINEWL